MELRRSSRAGQHFPHPSRAVRACKTGGLTPLVWRERSPYNEAAGRQTMLGPIGMQELVIIFIIALIVFGPRKLPHLGKSLGKSIAE
ncbi:MAG TPA: twin-arginine translocase TatA/TatE family subunit, partial [Vicinamibacteria bacterium]